MNGVIGGLVLNMRCRQIFHVGSTAIEAEVKLFRGSNYSARELRGLGRIK